MNDKERIAYLEDQNAKLYNLLSNISSALPTGLEGFFDNEEQEKNWYENGEL
ncbi:hypothetical protein SJ_243 [Proteus phage SJ_PmiM]|nr:hypothetical protein SJ_243 [Proteus phage SJ_PmiM]